MSDKPTPGPWVYGHGGDDFWVGPHWNLAPHVATVHWNYGEIEAGRANAALIAAAPNLLEALREIASIGPANDAFANLDLARTIARAAIALAGGKP